MENVGENCNKLRTLPAVKLAVELMPHPTQSR